jgi:hypothetical protein
MSPERQRHVLFGLLAVLAAIGAWQLLAPAPASAPAAAAAARRAAPAAMPAPPGDVALEALGQARSGPDDAGRNPFVFGARIVPASTASRQPRRDPSLAPALPPVMPAGPPPLPPIPLKFIGLVEGSTTTPKIAVLSDSKGLVVHGTEGAIIDGRYRILAIGTESIDIAYADGRGRQTLRLTGQ